MALVLPMLVSMSNLVPFKMLSAIAALDSTLPDWKLLEVPATSVRAYRLPVQFERAFSTSPLVQIAIVGLDVGKEDNVRLRVRALDVRPDGFTVHAETWFNTKIWAVEVSWLAIGS